MTDRLLPLSDVATRAGVSIKTVRAWRQKSLYLPFTKIGGKVMVSEKALEAFITANTKAPLRTRRLQ